MRRLPALITIIALALLITWIARRTYWAEESEPAALRGEAAANPFYAAQRLAELLGARAEWSHELLRTPPTNTVILVSSWNWNLVPTRRERLERWVTAGGRLVLDQSVFGARELQEWSGIGTDKSGNLFSSRKTTWSYSRWGEARAFRVVIGLGSVTILRGQPFEKLRLLESEQAKLFVDSTQLHAGDQIHFLTESTGASLLALIWRYGAPAIALALCLIALAIWRTSVRFGPLAAPLDPTRRSLAEQIRGTGRFTVRFGGGRALHAAVLRALNEAAGRRLPRYDRLPVEERVATLARVAGLDPGELAQAMNYSGPRHSGELRRAVAVLEFAQRAIALAGSHTKTIQEG